MSGVLVFDSGGPSALQELATDAGVVLVVDPPKKSYMQTPAGEDVDFMLVDQRGRPGPPGPAGPVGEPDVPDLTLIFENGLI